MQESQRLRSGLIVRQDFREAVRLVFYAPDSPEWPFWAPGGTAFIVNYLSRPYVITCGHILDQAEKGAEPVITNRRFGNTPVRATRVHRVKDVTGGILDADMGDVAVIAFDENSSTNDFCDTAYVIDDNTVGTSEVGDELLVHGALREQCTVTESEITPQFSTFEFDDVGATSEDPFIREAFAQYGGADFASLAGLSGSPVYNKQRRYLAGMVVRGGLSGGISRIRYVDISDIVKLLESIHTNEERVTYTKDVKRIPKRR